MIFLNIYVCTILFALFALMLMGIEIAFYAKEHNLISTRKKSVGRQLFDWFKLLLQCAIPLYNILCGFCFLAGAFSETFLENAVQRCIEEGKLKYKDAE